MVHVRAKPPRPERNPASPWNKGMRCALPFMEGGGTKVRDVSPWKNDANGSTAIVGTDWEVGPAGRGLRIGDATNAYLEIPKSSSMHFEDGMTVVALIQTTDTFGVYDTIANQWNGDANRWWLGFNGSNKAYFQIVAGGSQVDVTGGPDINDGDPHWVVGRWDGANIEIWVDGVLAQSAAQSGAMPTTQSRTWLGEIVGLSGYQLNQRMCDFRYLDYAIPKTLIHALQSDPWEYYTPTDPIEVKAPVAGGVTVTPASSTITIAAATGSVVEGSLSLSPATSLATLGATTGSIVAGSISITPASASLTIGATVGSVIVGGLAVSPATAQLTLAAQSGGVILGSLALSPAIAQIVLGADGTVVVSSGLVIAPAAAQIALGAAIGGVTLGSLAITTAGAQISLLANGSVVIPDGVVLAPARAILTLGASGTALGGGYVYVTPSAAVLTLGAQVGAALTGSLTATPVPALITLKAKAGYVASQEGWALNLGGQGGVIDLFASVGAVDPHGGGDGINELTGSFCPPNPALLFELYHPANDSESESLLVSERLADYGLDERILIRRPSGTIGYMRPLYCRFILEDPEAGTECINEAMISLVFGRMK